MEPEGAPAECWPARHFDGRTAESRPVTVGLEPGVITLTPALGDTARWTFGEFVLIRGDRAGEPVQLERRSQPVEVLIVDSPDFLPHLRRALPRNGRLKPHSLATPSLHVLLAVALAGAALLFALWKFAIPAFADLAAERVPPEWEDHYGQAMLEDLVQEHGLVSDPAVLRPCSRIEAALVPGVAANPASGRYVVLRSELPNAFAIPGGHIVLTTGLLRAMRTPDELAAVFAHESGHAKRRHVIRSILRLTSLQLLLSLVAGDPSALSSGLRTAGELGGLSYSRQYERQADDEAMVLLASHGTSPAALGDALDSIRRAAGVTGGSLGFLSTHPAPAERLERIRAASARLVVTGRAGWRDPQAWDAMKQALAAPRQDQPDDARPR